MERLIVLNDVPGDPHWRAAVDQELRNVLEPYAGPRTVRVRPVETWQGGEGWSVEVGRPGHVWTLRVAAQNQDPLALARYIAEAVQPERFGRRPDGEDRAS